MMQVVQKEREDKLAEALKDRLHLYVQRNKEEFIQYMLKLRLLDSLMQVCVHDSHSLTSPKY